MNHQLVALCVFIAAYVFFIFLPQRRSWVAVAAVVVLLLFGVLDPLDAFMHGVNWNVMGIFVGMLVLAEAFMVSRFPAFLAERIVNRAPNTAFAILFICAMTSFLSAFVENVATVLIIAPVALALAKKLNINPVNMMVAIAISSNLQGCATLIGDPPSMLLGGFAKMTFMDFFFYHGKPGIFFAVQLGAITSVIYLYFVFRHHKEKTKLILVETVQSWVPTLLLSLLILTLAASSFFDKGFSFLAGMICMVFALVTLLWQRMNHKTGIIENVKKLDWDTTFFLMGVFIVVESLTQTGWITKVSDFLSNQVGDNLF
ncbi:MAG TPA: SLC13 family permease, partial [Candidatus Hydrogenedentes bacterium]|nr:SLC13 family permease [Candidatus Hydrogenedentota bacterium]